MKDEIETRFPLDVTWHHVVAGATNLRVFCYICPSSFGNENCGIPSGVWPNTIAHSKETRINPPQMRLEAAMFGVLMLFTSTSQAVL